MVDAMRKICAVICARNEKDNIAETINSLKSQTYPIDKIIVVDDGSIDGTGEIAKKLGCLVVRLPPHEESLVGRPELAERINEGLKLAKDFNPDYILIVGADHSLPRDYVEKLLERMEENPRLVIASGVISKEPWMHLSPRGSGRLIKASFWREVSGLQYPVCWGWESWLCFKAL